MIAIDNSNNNKEKIALMMIKIMIKIVIINIKKAGKDEQTVIAATIASISEEILITFSFSSPCAALVRLNST